MKGCRGSVWTPPIHRDRATRLHVAGVRFDNQRSSVDPSKHLRGTAASEGLVDHALLFMTAIRRCGPDNPVEVSRTTASQVALGHTGTASHYQGSPTPSSPTLKRQVLISGGQGSSYVKPSTK